MKQSGEKTTRFNEYHDASYDDVRTIPDFYDNLYPDADRPETGFVQLHGNISKKREKAKNNEKSNETDGKN